MGMTTRTPLIAGNWKMNLDHLQAVAFVQKLHWTLKDAKHDYSQVEVVVIPPFTDIRSVQTLVDGDKLDITDDMTAAAASQGGKLVELYPMTTGSADNGYVMKISASGSQGSIVMMVGVDADKAITGISVVSHAETSGIGTKVVGNEPNAAGEPVLDQFIGESGAGSLVVGKNIIAVSGATVSTKGINMGANAALAVAELLG